MKPPFFSQTLFPLLAALMLFFKPSPLLSEFYLGGIQVNEPDHRKWVTHLEQAGMNTIAVTVYAKHADWDSANLWFEDEEKHVIQEIRQAKSQGLRVVLILRVALDHAFPRNEFLWHGMIMPRSSELRNQWFKTYTRFVNHWAEQAERERVDVLGIGSELSALTSTVALKHLPELEAYFLDLNAQQAYNESLLFQAESVERASLIARGHRQYTSLRELLRAQAMANNAWAKSVTESRSKEVLQSLNRRRKSLDESWRKVIASARNHFTGKITYAANFDQYRSVGFWDALDIIGINAYFPLRKGAVSSGGDLSVELRSGWRDVFTEISRFRQSKGLSTKPVVFTELGYMFRRNTTYAPWASQGFALVGEGESKSLVVWQEQEIDFTERALAIEALGSVVSKDFPNLLSGVLYWKLSTLASHIEIEPFVHVIGDKRDLRMTKALVRLAEGDRGPKYPGC